MTPRTGAALQLTASDFDVIVEAVRTVHPKMPKADREDVAQDVVIVRLGLGEPVEDLGCWAKAVASTLARRELAKRTNQQRKLARFVDSGCVVPPPANQHAVKYPKWHAPHPDAEEFAPLACAGARMMHVKPAFGGGSEKV